MLPDRHFSRSAANHARAFNARPLRAFRNSLRSNSPRTNGKLPAMDRFVPAPNGTAGHAASIPVDDGMIRCIPAHIIVGRNVDHGFFHALDRLRLQRHRRTPRGTVRRPRTPTDSGA